MLFKQSNSAVLKKSEAKTSEEKDRRCNCKNKASCPLGGNCLQSTVIYQATLETKDDEFTYIGLTEGTFKSRYYGHTNSFSHEKNENSTELSKKVWELKRKNTDFKLSWRIIDKATPYKGGSAVCNLCLTEKYHILTSNSKNLLNSRHELVSKCRHQNKFLLKNVPCKPNG